MQALSISLQDLRQQARQAYTNTSFDPEKRGDALIASYESELNADLEKLAILTSVTGQIDAYDALAVQYATNYRQYFRAWLHAKSRCISWMITGPARFPVQRAEKANRSEQNRLNDFRLWREKALKRAKKALQPPQPAAEATDSTPPVQYSFTGGVVQINYQLNRVQIFHDAKPAPAVIQTLKRQAFKWSPTNGCWQRQDTPNARQAAQHITQVKF